MNIILHFKEGADMLMVKAVKSNGTVIFIEANTAYNDHNLTLKNLFTKNDCIKVIEGMEFYNIVACQDAADILSGKSTLTEDFFTINDVLRIHRLLEN